MMLDQPSDKSRILGKTASKLPSKVRNRLEDNGPGVDRHVHGLETAFLYDDGFSCGDGFSFGDGVYDGDGFPCGYCGCLRPF